MDMYAFLYTEICVLKVSTNHAFLDSADKYSRLLKLHTFFFFSFFSCWQDQGNDGRNWKCNQCFQRGTEANVCLSMLQLLEKVLS